LGDEFQALVVHRTGEIEEDSKKGSYSLFFRPKKDIREKLYQYSNSENKDHAGYKNSITICTTWGRNWENAKW